MLKHSLHYLLILTRKVNEDVFIYLAAATPPMFILDWGQVMQAVIISCFTGTIPIFIKHWYRNNYPDNTPSNPRKQGE